jgi:hypothetical protein
MQCTDDRSAQIREFLNNINFNALTQRTQEIFRQACVVSQNFTRGAFAIVFEIVRKATMGNLLASNNLYLSGKK